MMLNPLNFEKVYTMSIAETMMNVADAATTATTEPVQAVIVDATGSSISRVIIEKVSETSPVRAALLVGAGVVAVGAVGYGLFKLNKIRKEKKAAAQAKTTHKNATETIDAMAKGDAA